MTNVDDVRLTGSQIRWGNLEGLAGTWQGANGFNMIAVPDQHGGFRLLVAPYTETLIVNKVPATTPNRGMFTIAHLPTLQYSTTIFNTTNPHDPTLMHVECGFWEWVHQADKWRLRHFQAGEHTPWRCGAGDGCFVPLRRPSRYRHYAKRAADRRFAGQPRIYGRLWISARISAVCSRESQ